MTTRIGMAMLALGAALLIGCGIFGGGDEDGGTPSASRPNSIPTATPPATLPEPIVLTGAATAPGPAGPTGPAAAPGSYTVKSGDTLLAIAAGQNVPAAAQQSWIAEVLRINGIADASLLSAGQTLRLPPVPTQAAPAGTTTTPAAGTPTPVRTGTPGTTPAAGATTPAGTATPRPTPLAGGPGTYSVQSGDNPQVIAEKLNVPEAQRSAWVAELIALNGINPSGLQIGQVLRLPPSTPAGGATSTTPAATATPVR